MCPAEFCPLRNVLKNGQIRCFDPRFVARVERPAEIVEQFCQVADAYLACPYYRANSAPTP